jgi:hypothetical protein
MQRSTIAVVMACGLAVPALAQFQPGSRSVRPGAARQTVLDSGRVAQTGGLRRPVFATVVGQPGATWVRLTFRDVELAGSTETESASLLVLTSIRDGARQVLNADELRRWNNTSAYFNGDSVRVELIASPGTGTNRVVVEQVIAGDGSATRSLCGTDDRVLSDDSRVGRLMPSGCSAFLINDAGKCMLTAGSCAPGAGSVVQFNVPLSGANGAIVHPSPDHQYPVDAASVQSSTVATGADWSYFGVHANSNTRLGAGASQGTAFSLASAPAGAPYTVRVTGYGTVALPVSLTWNQVQKVANGPLTALNGSVISHQADTTTGNAGSPIILASSGAAIGIHNADGCVQPGGPEVNVGTAIQNQGLQAALASPGGVCATCVGAAEPPIVIATDTQGNLATLSRRTATLGTVGSVGVPGTFAGLTYDRGRGRSYGSRFNPQGPDELYTLNPDTGAATLIGPISGAADIQGLGFDPNTDSLYGVDQGSGQLFRIDIATGAATPIGAPSNPNVGALDFDPVGSTLYGLEDNGLTGTRLVRISTLTGQPTVVGVLGAGIGDCDGLAYCIEDRSLYTVNQSNGQALRVNPATGVATLIGPVSGIAGPSYGMASRDDCAPPCLPNSPGPANAQFEISVFTSLYWNGCTNQKVYVVDNGPHNLLDVLTSTAQTTLVGSVAPTVNISGMTWDGAGLRAIDLSNGNLYAIDFMTGQPSLIAGTGITGWQGLAADPTEWGWLYGITQNNNLYQISEFGVATHISSLVGSLVTAFEFDSAGQLWGIEFQTGRILRINKSTGQITHVATTSPGFQSLDFDDAGLAFGHNSQVAGGGLYTINMQTGIATLRGSTNTTAVKAMAFGMPMFLMGGPGEGGPAPHTPAPPVRPAVNDATDLTKIVPVEVDRFKLIDETNRGLPAGYGAVAGVPVPGARPDGGGGRSGPTPACGGTLINFDDSFAGCSFGVSTRLTTQYEHFGVIFEGPAGNDGGATLNQCAGFNVVGYSGQNLLAYNTASTLADGGIPRTPQTLHFTSPVSSVRVLVGSGTSTGTVTLTAYRGSTVAATRTVNLTATMSPLSVLGTGITRAVITSTAPSFVLDDLCFVQSCPTLYDIYFGDDPNPPMVISDSPNAFWRPPQPLESTHLYYWRIVAKNCCGRSSSPVWRFTTQCYANCDGSTTPPVLNVADFTCFLQRYAAGDPYANCDNSTTPPAFNVADFTCYLQRYAEGCPGGN